MRQQQKSIMFYCGAFVLAAFSLNLIWSVGAYAQEEGPATVCILQLHSTGEVMAVVVDDTQDIDIAVVVPGNNLTNVPIRCADLPRLGVAVANQEPFQVTVTTTVYTNKGEPKCKKGSFNLAINGGRGVNFKDCV
jgi:hypothetical protein